VEHLFLISTAGLLQAIQSDENFGHDANCRSDFQPRMYRACRRS
jgi:hypothetical protein